MFEKNATSLIENDKRSITLENGLKKKNECVKFSHGHQHF